VAENDRTWLEIAFEGGQSLRLGVSLETAEGLDRALFARDESFAFDADDGRYTLVLGKVAFVKRSTRGSAVGFGAAA
jgi:hypothetical protein